MNQNDDRLLTEAVERNSAAVLSLPSAGMLRHFKTRFLRGEDHRIWMESVPEEQPLIQTLIQEGHPATVLFKAGERRVTFSSPIFEVDSEYRFFGAQTPVQAVLMHRPAAMKEVQRRSHYRAPVRPEDGFTVELWRISDPAALETEPSELCRLVATVGNLSVGGVGVIFAKRPLLVPETRIRVLLKHGNAEPMLIDGRSGPLRKLKGAEKFEAGIQFQDLQESLRGRQMLTELTRIVVALQLQEARRVRGLAG